jgi:factor associated with neutral sphingomyelinase activation
MECRARQVTPLIKQPGILVITDRGLYFQPLHNLAGGALVKFHPAAAITSLARRRIALRPTALEVFMQATDSSVYVANDQVRALTE